MSQSNGSVTPELRFDAGAFFSAALGFGVPGKDKLESFSVGRRRRLGPTELYELYEQNNFIANLIDSLPDAACQKWCKYECDTDPEPMQQELEKAKSAINQAWKLARLQGWAAVVLLINDSELDYRQPVNLRQVQGVSGYTVLTGGDAGEISVTQYDPDPFSLTYGQPELFTVAGAATPVHVSRLLLFYGVKKLSRNQSQSSGQLGTSVVDRCYQELRNFDVGNNAIANTLPDFNVDVLAIPGLAQLMAKQKDFHSYMAGLYYARSVLKVMFVEAGQNGNNAGGYQILNRNYTGVHELLKHFKQLFAGATDLPDTMLYGESPDGQTSGKYEMRSWSQYVANQQQTGLQPELEKLINYLHAAQGVEPQDWSLEFESILELDEVEKADIDLKRSQSLKLLTDAQVVTPDEAAKALAEDVEVGKAIDLEAREQERKALEQFPEGMASITSSLPGQPPPGVET